MQPRIPLRQRLRLRGNPEWPGSPWFRLEAWLAARRRALSFREAFPGSVAREWQVNPGAQPPRWRSRARILLKRSGSFVR